MAITGILLAAGLSTRMGQPKPLLAWQGTTLLEYQVTQLTGAGVYDVVVVLGHKADAVRAYLPPAARAILNPDYADGRASSLRAGAAAVPADAEAIVVLGVDQPRPAEVTARLLREHRSQAQAITLPIHQGHRGHPVVLAGALLPELRQASDETMGLRAVLERHSDSIAEVDCDSLVVLLDLNTPEDYERALRSW